MGSYLSLPLPSIADPGIFDVHSTKHADRSLPFLVGYNA